MCALGGAQPPNFSPSTWAMTMNGCDPGLNLSTSRMTDTLSLNRPLLFQSLSILKRPPVAPPRQLQDLSGSAVSASDSTVSKQDVTDV